MLSLWPLNNRFCTLWAQIYQASDLPSIPDCFRKSLEGSIAGPLFSPHLVDFVAPGGVAPLQLSDVAGSCAHRLQ